MEWQGWLTLLLTAAALLTLTLTRIAPHLVMMAVLTVLSLVNVLPVSDILSGFSNPGLITVAAMFVIAAGLHGSGSIDLLINNVLGQPKSTRSAMTRIFLPVAFLSAFINNTPVVAMMIPAINVWSRRINVPVSKLMIPLSYTAILGGTLTLIGTSTNLIVSSQYQAMTGNAGFSLFSITLVGLPVTIAGLLFMWLFFPKWLPDRSQKAFADLREFTLEVTVASNGPLVGKNIVEAGLRHLQSLFLVEIIRNGRLITAVTPDQKLEGGDRLVFAGNTQAITDLLRINGLVPSEDHDNNMLEANTSERRIVEAVVSPHCSAIGKAIRESKFRNRYGAVVLAVARNGERIKGNLGTIKLEAGDTLLLEARPAFITRQRYNKDFLLINELEERPPQHQRAYIAWAVLGVVVILAGLGITSMLNAALLGAGLMIVTGCCSVSYAEKSMDLMVLVTIGASFALGNAISSTGVADLLSELIINLSAGQAWLMLALTYLVVSMLTETITNNAAAILMLPIALDLTEKAHLNPEPFLFAIMIAASASFATPLGYQTNLMVYGPGGYRFSDFMKVGLPMNLCIGVITLAILLLGWPLYL